MKKFKAKMKISDYIRLGRLSIQARKKSTKNTVFGMSFGLILLVPMVFFAIAFYTDLSTQVNSIETAAELQIELKNINDVSASTPYQEYTSGNEGSSGLPAYKYYDDIISMPEVEDYSLSEYSRLSLMGNSEVVLEYGEEEVDFDIGDFYNDYNSNMNGISSLKIIYTKESSVNMFTAAELYDYKELTGNKNPLLSMCNDGFTETTSGKNEVIISQELLRKLGIDEEDIAGETISIRYPSFQLGGTMGYYQIDNDTSKSNEIIFPDSGDDYYDLYLFYEFEVVGIIKNDYYDLPGNEDEAHIWVTAESVYYPQGRQEYSSINYTITSKENTGTYLTFKDDIEEVIEKNQDDQYMMLIQSYADRYNVEYQNNKEVYNLNNMFLTVQIEDYDLLSTVIPNLKIILKSAYSDLPANDFNNYIGNDVYVSFVVIEQIGMILIIVFTAIGGIIFFTNMLNLLNTVRYSVESRKNYIGVMRAIGAKSRIIPRMYIFEMLIIFLKTFIRVAIFSSIISYGIKFGLDKAFSFIPILSSFTVKFIYYPIALGGAMVITTMIGTFFARISSKVTAYQPILKTLYDEK